MNRLNPFCTFPGGRCPVRLDAGLAESPFGLCQIVWGDLGVCSLVWLTHPILFPDPKFSPILRRVPHWQRNDIEAARLSAKIFCRAVNSNSPSAWVAGTPFQFDVWSALTRIAPGTTTTYGAIAAEIGNPRAARAVGSAIGANPVAFLIPCHRVVPATHGPGNFRWGRERKSSILAWEALGSAPTV